MSSPRKNITRREFLNKTGKTAAVGMVAAGFSSFAKAAPKSNIIDSNDRIIAAAIGVRGRGMDHAKAYAARLQSSVGQ